MSHHPGKNICCATQTRRHVQTQQLQKGLVKTTKSITLPPFSTYSTWLYQIKRTWDETIWEQNPQKITCYHIEYSVHPTIVTWSQVPTVTKGLRNISAKKSTIPARAIVCQVLLANRVPKLHSPEGKMSSYPKEGEDKILCIGAVVPGKQATMDR